MLIITYRMTHHMDILYDDNYDHNDKISSVSFTGSIPMPAHTQLPTATPESVA